MYRYDTYLGILLVLKMLPYSSRILWEAKDLKRSVMPQGGLLSKVLLTIMAGLPLLLDQHRGSRRLLEGKPSSGNSMMKTW